MSHLIEVTYYSPYYDASAQYGLRTQYTHQQLNIKASAIRWMRGNTKILCNVRITKNKKTTLSPQVPNTEMYVEGLGKIFVKDKRTDIKKVI